ncbi:MAG: DUF2723 domain-containing protein [Kiritimatiellae bacterium]|nr:DUF2723 domain-containing protein [Kiritimatiellia bacterium]
MIFRDFFSTETKPGSFFRKIDWSAFATATIVSFLVYFLTLGPSVTLEDCGELATAGDHLGVPHPPGYPIWTMFAYLFARLFSWVTFQGQPTPAWAISLMSSVFGAIAAGFTAMLITRSASDLLRHRTAGQGTDEPEDGPAFTEIFCWAGGVAGSLCFAFSPVMWSQATIVEVYSLNAFFLMWIFLLTYRWMRKPSDKILWLTAFVFGLGLTNYQVLLLAMAPLIVVVFLSNIKLFRDFLLVGIPIVLTAHVLQIGAEQAAIPGIKGPAYAKFAIPKVLEKKGSMLYQAVPSSTLLILAICLIALGVGLAVWAYRKRGALSEQVTLEKRTTSLSSTTPRVKSLSRFLFLYDTEVACGLVAAGGVLLLAAGLFTHEQTVTMLNYPLMKPAVYTSIMGAVALISAACIGGALCFREKATEEKTVAWLVTAGVLSVILIIILGSLPSARIPDNYMGEPFDWAFPSMIFGACLLVLFLLSSTVKRGIFYAIPVAMMQLSVFILLKKGGMNGLQHPSTWWFWWPIVWNFLILALAWLILPNGKTVALTTVFTELGAAFYVYMPIVSDLRNPPMNWGYPRTWEGFKHAITRGQYEKIKPSDIFNSNLLKQLGFYFTDLRVQFTLICAVLGFLPFTFWSLRWKDSTVTRNALPVSAGDAANGQVAFPAGNVAVFPRQLVGFISLGVSVILMFLSAYLLLRPEITSSVKICVGVSYLLHFATLVYGVACLAIGHRFKGVYVAAILYLVTSALVLVSEVMGGEPVMRLDKILIADIFLFLLVGAVTIVFEQIREFVQRTWETHDYSESMTVGITLAGIAAMICLFLGKGLLVVLAKDPLKASIGVKLGALSLAVLLLIAICAGAFFLRKFLQEKFDFRFESDNTSQQWLIATAAGFFMMSVVLVVLANVKGDLQDSFIQKVKFISSHGLFAIWIGYGMVFGLVIANRVWKWVVSNLGSGTTDTTGITDDRKQLLRYGRYALVVCVLLASAIPIYENYFNKWIAFALGGSEQNGHDYGWQFGNYSLRGAKAITEELDADEEPLPNPLYPKEMGPKAIFFGGTDPGRFVPTYMIYSADVRPDVFLITQNALADNTYMAVERDLYGDDIWIPTPEESAQAFQIYVDEVQAGKRPKNAALTIENGRVQVSGALGVMEINGILCEMMFRKNKRLHEFFVEESYVIRWMYPYLTPNGLVMRINPEKCDISPRNVVDDLDFWDWYSRKLVKSPQFRRDVPAQKSFSKLRSAIAGLYAEHRMFAEAESAFQEARCLYPVSPEANFRMIQEVLLPQSRHDEAIDILQDYTKRDPNNDRGRDFLKYLVDVKKTMATRNGLVSKYQKDKTLTDAEMYTLAEAFRKLGQIRESSQLLMQIAAKPGKQPKEVYDLAMTLAGMQQYQEATMLLDRVQDYILRLPADDLWLVAQVYSCVNDLDKMAEPLRRCLQLKPTHWEAWITIAQIYNQRGQRAEAISAVGRALTHGREQAWKRVQELADLQPVVQAVIMRMQQSQKATAGGFQQLPLGPRK